MWGRDQELMRNLDLRYEITYLGADTAASEIQAKLDAGLPAFFYLWSPHPLQASHSLNRIHLPAYTAAHFELGLSDYPTDVLEKVASKQLAVFAPDVADLYLAFAIDNSAQESMLARIDSGRVSAMEAACTWMRQDANAALWHAWLPTFSCEVGLYASDNGTSCVPCPPGSSSVGGAVTACVHCSAGTTVPFHHTGFVAACQCPSPVLKWWRILEPLGNLFV
jgi:hypothetical protein